MFRHLIIHTSGDRSGEIYIAVGLVIMIIKNDIPRKLPERFQLVFIAITQVIAKTYTRGSIAIARPIETE